MHACCSGSGRSGYSSAKTDKTVCREKERKRERERERETDRERGRERSTIGPFHDRNMLPKPNFRNCSQDRGSKNNIFIRKHVVAAAKAKQSVS
jgi:hypothetical protein